MRGASNTSMLPKAPSLAVLVIALLATLSSLTRLHAALYTFDSTTGLEITWEGQQAASGGVTGGALKTPWLSGAHTTAADLGSLGVGKTYTVSADFHVLGAIPIPFMRVGIFGEDGRNYISFGRGFGGSPEVSTQLRSGPLSQNPDRPWESNPPWEGDGHQMATTLTGTIPAASSATWLRVTLVAAYIGNTGQGNAQWSFLGTVSDLGTTGLAVPDPIYSSEQQFFTSSDPATGSLHGSLYTYGQAGTIPPDPLGSDFVDNFFAIPEPSVTLLSMLTAAGAGLCRRWRR